MSVHRCGVFKKQELLSPLLLSDNWSWRSPGSRHLADNRVHLEATYGSLLSSLPWDLFSGVDVSPLFLFEGIRTLLESTEENNLPYMQIWALLISIHKISLTKEMNPITRKSMSKLVIQPSFRAKHTLNGRHSKNLKIRDKCMAVGHSMSWNKSQQFSDLV